MKIRKLFAAAAVSAGLFGATAPAFAAEPAKKPTFGFSTMKAATPEAAKAKCEAWLKSVNKFDQAAFDKVWANETRTVLDRTADALAMGHTEAAALLALARNPNAPAVSEVPGFLKDDKQDAFFRTNVALAFAKASANKKVYEEALDALKSANADSAVDPASFFFFKAVSEHATMKKADATSSIVKLLDDVGDSPARYTMVATLMFFDMQNWAADPKDLSNIEKLMDNSGRRLDLARGGEKTQDIQKKIVFRLDELIKELENKGKGGGGGQANGGNCPGGGDKPGSGNSPGNGNNVNPTQNAPDSTIMGGSGKGEVPTAQQLRQIAEQWGTMPADKRAKVVQDITRDLPVKFEPLIKHYFEALDKQHGYKK
ncbi:MAG: hypothetical protein FJ304_13320 [Planctomycetes bacterium]|nr:hypothetical protein [Planctomycetota bacterium]